MPQKKRDFVVEQLLERKSCIAVQAAFQQQFNQAQPYKKTIEQNFAKYRSHGTSVSKN